MDNTCFSMYLSKMFFKWDFGSNYYQKRIFYSEFFSGFFDFFNLTRQDIYDWQTPFGLHDNTISAL